MQSDGFGNHLSADETAAAAYSRGLELFLTAQPGAEEAFGEALTADPDFALAHVGVARHRQLFGDRPGALEAMQRARSLSGRADEREAGHIRVLGLLLDGDPATLLRDVLAHVEAYPRDALVVDTCTGVFGLIGFSGLAGREAEHLALTTKLLPHYGDDWWFLGQHAFAQGEAGQLGPARATIDRALIKGSHSAHNAHIHAHISYEAGEHGPGRSWLRDWVRDYPRDGAMHCHLSWHLALWCLEMGETEDMWRLIDEDVTPGMTSSPPLNILTDYIAFLFRAHLRGVAVDQAQWRKASDYAARLFAKPGLAFADIHTALAHAMAGEEERFRTVLDGASGPAGERVRQVALASRAYAEGDWPAVVDPLMEVLGDSERLGGSRAQRDVIVFMLHAALKHQQRDDAARLLLAVHRPLWSR